MSDPRDLLHVADDLHADDLGPEGDVEEAREAERVAEAALAAEREVSRTSAPTSRRGAAAASGRYRSRPTRLRRCSSSRIFGRISSSGTTG